MTTSEILLLFIVGAVGLSIILIVYLVMSNSKEQLERKYFNSLSKTEKKKYLKEKERKQVKTNIERSGLYIFIAVATPVTLLTLLATYSSGTSFFAFLFGVIAGTIARNIFISSQDK